MGIALHHEVAPHARDRRASRIFDEMGPGVETGSPAKARAGERRRRDSDAKKFRPALDARPPGMRGGWKPRQALSEPGAGCRAILRA